MIAFTPKTNADVSTDVTPMMATQLIAKST
jgi:hypothetical protein